MIPIEDMTDPTLAIKDTDEDLVIKVKIVKTYIQKGGFHGCRTPQTIWIFRRKIVWERENYQDNTVYRAIDWHFPVIMFSHCSTFW